ncbi:MAG: Nucleotidyltransferase domain protein [Deltaproteobacteria bacterium ADurb.Bin151]|nr:MAG: Nucleotidyltransferase domain protein [Deltaproteobacteria bacterium ADurb.Bin151]
MTGSSSHHINIQELSMIFKRKRWLAAAYLFGSTVTGRKRPGSDLDLAIITKKTISGRERLKMETDLAGRLGRDVDLVVFGQASALLQHQILKHGRLIYENDPAERVRQEVQARNEYMDTRHLFREIP